MNSFDFHQYARTLTAENRLARREGFHFCTCSGLEQMQGALEQLRAKSRFVVADDVTTGETVRRGGSFFQRRTFTLFLLSRFRPGDEASRRAALDLCRELRRQIESRMVRDSIRLADEMVYLHVDQMPSTETGSRLLAGCTGLYLMVTVDEPLDLCFREEEWDE